MRLSVAACICVWLTAVPPNSKRNRVQNSANQTFTHELHLPSIQSKGSTAHRKTANLPTDPAALLLLSPSVDEHAAALKCCAHFNRTFQCELINTSPPTLQQQQHSSELARAGAAAAAMSAAAELTMLQLYRHILKAAKQFPSIKKHSIIQQVKTEFRENAVRGAAPAHVRKLRRVRASSRGACMRPNYPAAAGHHI